MYTATFLLCMAAAWWLDKKLKGTKLAKKTWWLPIGLGILGGMALYLSGLGTLLARLLMWILSFPSWLLATLTGEYIAPVFFAGVIAGFCLLVIAYDLWQDHTYNPAARNAMIVGPIAAIPATGWVGQITGLLNTTGADTAVTGVRALFGG